MWALVSATWREKLSRPIPLVLCLLLCAFTTGFAVSVTHNLEDPALILALLLGSGSVGRDVSSGVLGLLFTRPLRRSTYVLSKWLAVSSAAATLSTLTLLAQALLLARHGIGVPAPELWAAIFATLTAVLGLCSVLVFFSVLVPGVGDVALWAALSVSGLLARKVFPLRVTDEWQSLLRPTLGWTSTFQSTPISWFSLFSYLSTVTLCLLLAVLAANRKELSYASS
jgi:ABC-type transport system involved in multi-copper enzyme maturation permease subunit